MLTGRTLKAIRGLSGMTQADLSKKACVSMSAIAEYEVGKRELTTGTVRSLAAALGVEFTYVIDGTSISGP